MSAMSVEVPYPVFTDRDGEPLENGYVWVGTANLNPQTNPIQVYFDRGLTQPAQQPLRTIAGYVSNAGTPAQIYVNASSFSILVQDKNGTMVYNFPDGTGISQNASGVSFIGFKGQVGNVQDLADDDGSNWIGFEQEGTNAVAVSVQDKLRQTISVKDFGAVGDGVTNDTLAIQEAINAAAGLGQTIFRGANIYIPAGTYLISNTLTVPTNSPTEAFISFYGDGSPSTLQWVGVTDDPILYFPHNSDRMHVFVDKLNFLGIVVAPTINRGIAIRYGTPSNPSGFVVNFSVTNCKFNSFSTVIEAHGEADVVLIQKNYIGEFTVAGIKYFQPNNSGWQIIGNHFREGRLGSTCIIGDSTGAGNNWLIEGNVLQGAGGMGIFSMKSITNVTIVNNYLENSGVALLTDLSPYIFTDCRNVTLEDNITNGRVGPGATINLLGTTQSVRIGNNYHAISAMFPAAWLFFDPSVTGVALLGRLTTTPGVITPLFLSGSNTNLDLAYSSVNEDNQRVSIAQTPFNEINDRQNAGPSGGTITLKTLDTSFQAYYVYAFNRNENLWSYGIVSKIGSNAPEYHSVYQKSSNLVISISGNNIIVTNGISATRTINYSLTRIF